MGILKGLETEVEVHTVAKITMDLGRVETLKFKTKFRRRTKREAQAIIEQMTDPDTDVTEESILQEDLLGWRDLKGDGGDVEYTPENLDAMLNHIEYVKALFEAWGVAQMGRSIANAKN